MRLGQVLRFSLSSSFRPFSASHRSYSTASNIPKQATVARYLKIGGIDVVKLQEEDLPPLSNNGVLVKMLFAPVNPADINMIAGTYPIQPSLPAIAGNEGLGQVIAVGDQVGTLKVGDLVFPSKPGFGTWRTHATCEEKDLTVVPPAKDVPHEYLASLSINPVTAYRLLSDFVDLKSGDVVIQNGANSMVGLSVIQLAAHRGIKTINIIRRRSDYAEAITLMKNYGAYIAVADDYVRTAEFRQLISDLPKPKLALNCIGGHTVTEFSRLIANGGTIVTYGGMSYKPVTVPTSSLLFNNITLKGFWLNNWYESVTVQARTELYKELISLIQQKKLRLWVERYPFTDLNTALTRAVNSSTRSRKVMLSFV